MTEAISKRKFPIALALWIAAAALCVGGIYWSLATGALSWQTAISSRDAAESFVAQNIVLAYTIYVALFIGLAVILFPAQLWIIMFGAILFGFWPALIVSWLAAAGSAVCVFLLARGVLADRYRARADKYLGRIAQEFQRDQLSWMLVMRFVPIVPYCISNAAPAFLGARFTPFLIATMIGVIPSTAIYTFVGARAASVLDRNTPPDIASLAADAFPIMLALAALPVLALVIKRLRRGATPRTP